MANTTASFSHQWHLHILQHHQAASPITAKKATTIKVTPTTLTNVQTTPNYPRLSAVKLPDKLTESETIGLIDCTRSEPKVKQVLNAAHTQFRKVFDKDLTGGYNGYFGQHTCRLNWSSLQRPTAQKVPVANYDHDLKSYAGDM